MTQKARVYSARNRNNSRAEESYCRVLTIPLSWRSKRPLHGDRRLTMKQSRDGCASRCRTGGGLPMKTLARITVLTIVAVVLGLAATSSVHAIPVIANGGFEAGLTSWTKADQLGSEGTFFSQSGTASPVNAD